MRDAGWGMRDVAARLKSPFRGRHKDRMLGGVLELGRYLVGADLVRRRILFFDYRYWSVADRFGFALEFGEGDRAHIAFNTAEGDTLPENVDRHHLSFACGRRDDSALLRESLARLNVEIVLIAQAAHQSSARAGDLRRIEG